MTHVLCFQMLQEELRRGQRDGSCERPADQLRWAQDAMESKEQPTATDVLIHSLLHTPMTPTRPRHLLSDPLQTPRTPASAPTQDTHRKHANPLSGTTFHSDPAAPRNASSSRCRSPGITWSAPSAHSRARTPPWNPAGISPGTFLRPHASPAATPRKHRHRKVSPRYLDFMDNPRIVRGREESSRPHSASQQMYKHGGDLSPLPRVAFLSPPRRGQELARTLGIRTKEELEEEEELEVRHSPTMLKYAHRPMKSNETPPWNTARVSPGTSSTLP
jgi:hypothetical protein